MRRALVLAAGLCALAFPSPASADHWRTGACGLPTALPLYGDFAEVSVSPLIRREIFGPARPPLVLASSGAVVPLELRTLGAHTVYWHMKLERLVGGTRAPAATTSIAEAAARVVNRAAAESGCATPVIVLNELFGAWVQTPWSPTNAQYRENVLALLNEMHALGAHPYLLVPTTPTPFTGSAEAVSWWQQAARVSDLVLEVHFDGRSISKRGAIVGSRRRRLVMRRVLTQFNTIGVPLERLGLMHGFQSGHGFGGREGLPLPRWLRVVKWETLAARAVADERAAAGTPLGSVWSWGWGDFPEITRTSVDPDKPVTACVYLWSREPGLCDAPARAAASAASFNASRTEGQIAFPATIHCSLGRGDAIVTETLTQLASLRTDRGPLGRKAALTALLSWIVNARHMGAEATDVERVEEAIVARTFAGNREAFEAALAQGGVTVTLARALIADELRRERIAAQLPRGRTYAGWLRRKQAEALRTAICQRDDLPDTGVVSVTAHLPFLSVP